MRNLPAPRVLVVLVASFLALWTLPFAQAQRLLVEKAGVLYAASEDGKDARRLLEVPPGTVRWTPAPDGRRIAFMTRAGFPAVAVTEKTDLANRPVTVLLADITGRRRKRLFTTASLIDRQKRSVNRMGVSLSDLPKNLSNPEDAVKDMESFTDWQPYSLSWSADSRTLYLSCYRDSPVVKRIVATVTVDSLAGVAIVDGEGRWKSIASLVDVEARGGLLVGASGPLNTPLPAGTSPGPPVSSPLVVANLAEGTRTPLFTGASENGSLPPYAVAGQPALAPENRLIAFVAGGDAGLFATDRYGKSYRRLAEGGVLHPRWSSDGKRVLFLLPRPTAPNAPRKVYDLYAITVSDDDTALPAPPTLILQGVDWFDLTA